jgi:hypothetical protein
MAFKRLIKVNKTILIVYLTRRVYIRCQYDCARSYPVKIIRVFYAAFYFTGLLQELGRMEK